MIFDIQVTFTVEAEDEANAEWKVADAINFGIVDLAPNAVIWDFTESVSEDLSKSCCC